MNTVSSSLATSIRLAAVLCLLLSAGCQDKRRHQSSEEVEFAGVGAPVADEASPETVVLALLDAMVEVQQVRRIGLGRSENKDRYDEFMGTTWSLVDQDRILDGVRKGGLPMVPKDITKNAAVRIVVESWISTVAHYFDGLLLETMATEISRKGDHATVRLEIENPDERQRLDEIEADPQMTGMTGKDGNTLSKTGPEYLDRLRLRTLAEGFNVPIRKRLAIRLSRVGGAWRAYRLELGPISGVVQLSVPTSQAAAIPQS